MATSTDPVESFAIPTEAAELYESAFVPAFFAQWAPMLCDAAGVSEGHRAAPAAQGRRPALRTR